MGYRGRKANTTRAAAGLPGGASATPFLIFYISNPNSINSANGISFPSPSYT